MKAIIHTKYGSPDVLKYQEIDRPTPKENEVLVKVYAAAVNAGDNYMMQGKPFLVRLMGGGLFAPKHPVFGNDIAGQVVAVGSHVTQFQVGDEVFGESGFGAFAEYACVSEAMLGHKPTNLSFEEAAAVPVAGVTALQGIQNNSNIQLGQKVLINGASGGVGTFAVQIAKAYGAEVTAVCSTGKMEMARAIGADHVIDYTKEDFIKNGQRYDLIFGVNGYRTLSEYQQTLSNTGTYVCIGGTMSQIFESMLMGPFLSKRNGKKIKNMGEGKANQKDLATLKMWIEEGKVFPIIDKCYPLNQLPEALRYLGQGHAKGKVVIQIVQQEKANI